MDSDWNLNNALFSSEFLCDGIGTLTIIRSILSAHMSYYQGRATFTVDGIFVEIPVLYNKSGNPRVLFCTGDLQRIYEGKLKKDLI